MNITVKTHHVDITDALKAYAEKKLAKVDKFFENIQDINIELNIEERSVPEKRQIAKGTLHASGITIRAEEAAIDMYASIDLLFEKVSVQLKKT